MTRLAPLWQQNNTYPAAVDRGLLTALFPAGTSTGHTVTTVNNTMNVSIAAGTTMVPMASNAGTELCRSDAADVLTLTTAPGAGLQRIDVICVQPRDSAVDAGGNDDFIFSTVIGTAAASAVAPAVPAGRVALAQVLIPGTVVNLNTATVTDRRLPLLDLTKMPRGRLAYADRQSNFAATVEADVGVALTVTFPANRYIRLISMVRGVNGSVTSAIGVLRIREGATEVYGAQYPPTPSLGGAGGAISCPVQPTAGVHTYRLTLEGSGGTNTIQASATFPCSLEIVDEGGY